MFNDLSPSALAAAAADCADRKGVNAVLDALFTACGARHAMIYRFDRGLLSAADEWAPLYNSFPAEITEHYQQSRYIMDDYLARAAFSADAPVHLTKILDGLDAMPARQRLHALFGRYGVQEILGFYVSDRPGRMVYIALGYDRPLQALSPFEERRLRLSFEMVLRHAGGLLDDDQDRALSPKERSVLAYLAAGASNKTIAHKLGLSVSTVNTLVERCYEKLGARNRTEAAVAAARAGFPLVA